MRLIEERQSITVAGVQLAAAALAALPTASHDGAIAVLRSLRSPLRSLSPPT